MQAYNIFTNPAEDRIFGPMPALTGISFFERRPF